MSASPGRGRFTLAPLASQQDPGEPPAALRPIAELYEATQRILQKELDGVVGRSRSGMLREDDIDTLGKIVRTLKAIESTVGTGGDVDPSEMSTEQLAAIAGRKR